ncbi:MAG: DUF2029 domain-containing protein [Methanoregula sp.]|uniref:glycosyltransferase family 87 protein n=1 Tax=Methanoregula sp. TaxID=2052170 RepID=UPI0025EA3289|nr:glycosyltransferase family 87 protein [Methanoregula sp.]MCK9630606.1 DUF2029 domain-containing protein [Methanoregula sp.]
MGDGTGGPSRSSNPVRYTWYALCGLLIALTVVQLAFILSDTRNGWDYRVYQAATWVFDNNENPYVPATIQNYTNDILPFVYPPHTLILFWVFRMFLFFDIHVYYAFLVALLVAGSYLVLKMDDRPEYLLLFTLVFTAFISLSWNFLTGNKAIVLMFLFVVALFLLVHNRLYLSAAVMGIMVSFSLVPLPFIALYLVVRRPLRDRVCAILASAGTVAGIFFVSFLLYPALMGSYLRFLTGGESPLFEIGGWNTPTPYLMFSDLLSRAQIGGSVTLAIVSVVYIALVLVPVYFLIRDDTKTDLFVYSLATLAIFMILPRTKPYDFILLAVPLYFILKGYTYPWRIAALAGISLMPLAVWYALGLLPDGALPYVLDQYVQAVSLFFVFALVVVKERFFSEHDERPGQGDGDAEAPREVYCREM